MKYKKLLARTHRVPEPEAMALLEEARVYDRVVREHTFLDWCFVRDVLSRCPRGGLVLDVGCGSGLVPALLTKKAESVEVVALDISEAMLGLAQTNVAGDGARLRFLRSDGKALPFDDGTFDAVVSHHVIHHLADPVAMLREMQRVLKTAGWIYVRDLRRPDHGAVVDLYVAVGGRVVFDDMGADAEIGRRQYSDSLAAALSRSEWGQLAETCGIPRQCISTRWFIGHQDVCWRKPA